VSALKDARSDSGDLRPCCGDAGREPPVGRNRRPTASMVAPRPSMRACAGGTAPLPGGVVARLWTERAGAAPGVARCFLLLASTR
jgi:hypothetical protein